MVMRRAQAVALSTCEVTLRCTTMNLFQEGSTKAVAQTIESTKLVNGFLADACETLCCSLCNLKVSSNLAVFQVSSEV